MTDIDGDTTVVATPETVSTEVNGERVLLNLETGLYHGMNSVGADIFGMIDHPTTVTDISTEISEKYDIDRDQAQADIQEFLGSLLEAGLVEVKPRAASA